MQSTPHQLKTLYHWLCTMLLGFMIVSMSACNAQTPDANAPQNKVAPKPPVGTSIGLTLTGYNYTNRYINTFEVNGQGGGNLFVSDSHSGGGGSVCCVSYITGPGVWKVTVRWQTAACTYNERTSGGERFYDIYSFFKEARVEVDPKVPDHPGYFEVHIYPDGHVEAAITEAASPPRLILSEDREDKSHYPRCPNGKKPKE